MPSQRVEFIEASVHWTHCTEVVVVRVVPLEAGRARVELEVSNHGDYWEPTEPPVVKRISLEGGLSLGEDRCAVEFGPDAPFAGVAFDPRRPERQVFEGPECDPLDGREWIAVRAWARGPA